MGNFNPSLWEVDSALIGDYEFDLNEYEEDPLAVGRFATEGPCWPSWGDLHDGKTIAPWRWWVDCGDCGHRIQARSEESLRRKMAWHVGEEAPR